MIQATLLLLLAFCLAPSLGRRSAAERHLLWTALLAAAALVPLLRPWLPTWEPAWARAVAAGLPVPFAAPSVALDADAVPVVVRATGTGRVAHAVSPFLLIWIAGTAAVAARLALDALALVRMARASSPVVDDGWRDLVRATARELGLRRPIALLQSRTRIVPVTWGLRRARVLVPADAGRWSTDRRRAVLAHELAHARRGDWLIHLAAELACAAYWFHPLFWLAKSRLCRESERAADDEVLAIGVDGSDYAAHLLDVVRAAQWPARSWSPALAMGRRSQLGRRIAAVLTTNANRIAVSRPKAAAAALLALAVTLLLGTMTVRGGGVNITIRTTGLPPMPDAGAGRRSERPAAPVRSVRVAAVDGPLDAAVTPPDVLEYSTPPLYSEEARRLGVEGIATVEARIAADGAVGSARIVGSLGHGLDQNALVAVRQWRFRPALRSGQPIPVWADIDVEFSLRSEAVNELIANDMATRVGPGVAPPHVVRTGPMLRAWRGREDERHGTVVLDVVLLENGSPKIVRILQSVDPQLDERAVRNFEEWRFSPAMKDGRPIKVRMNAEVRF